MKTTSGVLILSLTLAIGYAAGRSTAQSAQDQSVETVVARLKHDLVQAYINRDAKELERIYADDFTVTDSEANTRTKADELAGLKAGGNTLTSGRYDVVKVRVFDDVAVMSGHGDLQGASESGPYHTRYYSFNVFVRRDGRWQYVAAFIP